MKDAVDLRAARLDTMAAVLPMDRRDELAELLTDQDVETLRHLVEEGMGPNTLRALTSDLAYLQAWSLAAIGTSLPWPAPEALLLKFVAHHLWRPDQRQSDPDHGMPKDVEDTLRNQRFLRASGPHAPATVRRRLANWSTLTKWRGADGYFSSSSLKSALRLAVRAHAQPRRRKSAKAITSDVLMKLVATCDRLDKRDVRDRAILMVAFASGGRRRSEIAGLRREQITEEEPIQAEDGSILRSVSIHLGRTKTSNGFEDELVYLTGTPVDALFDWIAMANIAAGSIFRRIDRWGNLSDRPLDPSAVNDIVKHRVAMAGLEPNAFSAHGLRAGYLTEAANQGIPLPEAMEQSKHRSVQQASDYYNHANRRGCRAARILR
ncbi:site-specific integrase [Ensifer sp. ENS02]|uniref:site-specific integrase n=1 Tax=Ensifer sp. ENS02 TaxID=2769290 RepID=UPI001FEDA20E|nr:site-specific integrase [Ensifer sp. ENS02]